MKCDTGLFSKVCIIAVLLAVITFTAGCIGTDGTEDDTGKVVVWAWDTNVVAAEEAAKAYSAINPDVTVEVVNMAQEDVVTKLNLGLSDGIDSETLPDIVLVEDYNLFGYLLYFPDAFVDLTDSISADDFSPFKLDSMMYNNRLYGVPFDSGVTGMFYRLDVIEDAGFTEEDMQDLTWDEYIAIGKVVKEKTGYDMLPVIVEGNMEGRIILQSCGEWYVEDDGKTLNIEENEGLYSAISTVDKLHDAGIMYVAANWDDMVYSIYNSKICTVVGACWWAPIIKEEASQSGLWRVAKIPKVSDNTQGTSYSNLGGSSWCVLNNDNQENSIDFLKHTFASDTELINTLVEEINLVSTLNAASDVSNYLVGDPYFGGQQVYHDFVLWSEEVPEVNYGYITYEIDAIVGKKMVDVLNGKEISAAIHEINAEAKAIQA